MGVGLATCGRYLEARTAGSGEYFLFGGWIAGYLSARNQVDADTYTLAPWQTPDVLAGFLADYCSKHRDEIFLRAMIVMADALKADRLTRRSERVTVTVDPESADFFRATLLKLEQALAALDYDPGPADGVFDARTQRALRQFQDDRSLDPTGFPNQLTLFRLFQR